jgi:hypothetical protein
MPSRRRSWNSARCELVTIHVHRIAPPSRDFGQPTSTECHGGHFSRSDGEQSHHAVLGGYFAQAVMSSSVFGLPSGPIE